MCLKEKLLWDRPCRIVGAYDAISCALAEKNEFDAIWASGLCISTTQGYVDANIMSHDNLLNILKTMVRSTNLPIIADCDTGYGDFHNVINLVDELCQINVKGMCIEDKVFPKINSFSKTRSQILEKPNIFAAKIKAAVENRKSKDFLVIARTEAFIAQMGIDEAIYRANMYEYSGADALVIHSKKESPDEIFEFMSKWHGTIPVIVIPTTFPTLTIKQSKEYGISGIIYANQTLRAAISAIDKYLKELSVTESLSEIRSEICSINDIFDIQGMNKYRFDESIYREYENSVTMNLCEFYKNKEIV